MKLSYKFLLLVVLGALVLLFSLGTIRASAQSGLLFTAEAGLDGYCKPNAWLPVRITIENTGDNIEGELYAKVNENNIDWEFNRRVAIPSVSRKELTIFVHPPGNRISEVEIGLISDGNSLFTGSVNINCAAENDILLGVWAQNPSLFNPQVKTSSSGNRTVLLVLDERTLPGRSEGLEMLDTLTISNVDVGKLSTAQREAIATWITKGGKLILTGGPNWLETSTGWSFVLPLTPQSTTTVSNLNQLQNAVPNAEPLEGQAVVTTGKTSEDAVIFAGLQDFPLIIIREHGFGSIIYFAADPTLTPIRTWTGMGELYESLIGIPNEAPPWSNGFQDWLGATEALNTIEGLGMPPFILICGFIDLYIVIVGPLNFIILRSLKKHDLAWVSIPVLVVFFTGIILLISSTLLGNRPIVNRLSIVQVWPGENQASVNGLVGVFSPQRDTYLMKMDGDFLASPIPPQGFGSDGWNHQIFQEETGIEIPEFRIDVGGLQGIAVTGKIPAPAFESSFTIEMSAVGSPILRGTFINNSDITFKDVVLLSGAQPSQLGDIGPGGQANTTTAFSGTRASSAGISPNTGVIPYGIDNTLMDLFGTNYMYTSNLVSVETYRRFNLMSAALGGAYGSRGGSAFLIGWTDKAPFETSLSGKNADASDTTAYVFHINPTHTYSTQPGDEITLPPGMFSWSVLDTPKGGVTASPYEGYLNEGEFALRFAPLNILQFSSVKQLTLHMDSYGAGGPVELMVNLWDFNEGRWSRIAQIDWGDTNIPAPARFVSPDGEIRLKLENPTAYGISVEVADFTLVIER